MSKSVQLQMISILQGMDTNDDLKQGSVTIIAGHGMQHGLQIMGSCHAHVPQVILFLPKFIPRKTF